ncbi:SDR family NAD(P)-dependent oxidoreductase [Streptomyces sp. H27-G5]|uniref:SDR family NAD(P)-dependent oxidoreductase n=1 Tax=Streptomyces sp. H27-G5 TaxID=2996698 RepID=UPI00226EE39E|nr:SDR family NAD(P)-dependent oxidoreductase [Streptomyces sp. H27-G5]MCY0924081.1 SDR family NAD(P)-dependent oxidoreductase [Streptomyces sp. H27-G5]
MNTHPPKKTYALIGAGPNLGARLARRFASEGFRIAAISRSPENLAAFVSALEADGIEAAAFPADVTDPDSLTKALTAVEATYGPISVMQWNAMPGWQAAITTLDITPDNVQHALAFNITGPIAAVRAVLPAMRQRGEGAMLFTTGASGLHPLDITANLGLSMAALRNYLYNLHEELKPSNIYVGTITVGDHIAKDHADPDVIADRYWDMLHTRDCVEEQIGDAIATFSKTSQTQHPLDR